MIRHTAPSAATNGLRLALALTKSEPTTAVTVFLMADAVVAAKAGQKIPDGYYNVERMLRGVCRQGTNLAVRHLHGCARPDRHADPCQGQHIQRRHPDHPCANDLRRLRPGTCSKQAVDVASETDIARAACQTLVNFGGQGRSSRTSKCVRSDAGLKLRSSEHLIRPHRVVGYGEECLAILKI